MSILRWRKFEPDFMQIEFADSSALNLRQKVGDFVSLTKPRIMMLSSLTVLGAMSMASQTAWPEISVILATLAGVALAVGAGGSLNCFIERETDRKMLRTSHRPLPSGRIRPLEALIFGTILWITSYFLLYFYVNPPTAFLTMLAFGSYVGLYTPLKKHSSLCTLVGAVPGALPPLIGWTAVRGHVEFSGFLLFLLMFFWQIPHFLALALLRREDYAKAGMPMLPVEQGEPAALRQILLYTAALLPISMMPYGLLGAGGVYLGLAMILGATFFGMALMGVRHGARPGWCGKFFYYSILYIAALFSALVFDS